MTYSELKDELKFLSYYIKSCTHEIIALHDKKEILIKVSNIKNSNTKTNALKECLSELTNLGYNVKYNQHNPVINHCNDIPTLYYNYLIKNYEYPEVVDSIKEIKFIDELNILLVKSTSPGLLIGKHGHLVDKCKDYIGVPIRFESVRDVETIIL